MTCLHYTLQDAHRWAAFSGDYNPIHFDSEWVKSQGRTTLSVHGMRALLDVKRFISPRFDNAPFLKCTVRLRRPLWCDTCWRLVRDSKKAMAARVTDLSGEQTCISCQLMPEESIARPLSESHYIMDKQRVRTLQQAFAPLLPDAQLWHFLDALLFRHLLQDEALLQQDVIAAILPQDTNLSALFSRYPVVQTHQEVIFDTHLLTPWQQAFHDDLRIDTLPTLVVGDLLHGCVVRIAAKTCYQNSVISNAITLKIDPTGQ